MPINNYTKWDDVLWPTDDESRMNEYVPLDLFWEEAENLSKPEPPILIHQEEDIQLHCRRIIGAYNQGSYYFENFLKGSTRYAKGKKNEL